MTKTKNAPAKKAGPKENPMDANPNKMPLGFEDPATPLGKVCERFRAQADRIKTEQKELQEIGLEVLAAMKKEKRDVIRMEHDGIRYVFEIKSGKEKVVCTKEAA